jgi:hypothetical protein
MISWWGVSQFLVFPTTWQGVAFGHPPPFLEGPMTQRVLHGLLFDVESPSRYRSSSWPDIAVSYDGWYWWLNDSRRMEPYQTLDAAARRLRAACATTAAQRMTCIG